MLSAALCDHIPNVPFTKDYEIKIIGYCYHSVNVINFGLNQNDHIKQLLLLVIFRGSLKSDYNKRLIILTVITLSGLHFSTVWQSKGLYVTSLTNDAFDALSRHVKLCNPEKGLNLFTKSDAKCERFCVKSGVKKTWEFLKSSERFLGLDDHRRRRRRRGEGGGHTRAREFGFLEIPRCSPPNWQ